MSGSGPKTDVFRNRTETYRPPVELEPGLWRLRVAQPRFAANYVYLLQGAVPTLIDSGHPDPGTQRQLDRGLADLGMTRADLAQVLYTHTHLDHLGGGMASWDAPELAHVEHRLMRSAVEAGVDVGFADYTIRLHEWFSWMNALPDHPYLQGLRDLRDKHPHGTPWLSIVQGLGKPTGTPFEPGDRIAAGDIHVDVVDVHGHDPHHVAFVGPSARWAITGDVVVGTPTPLVPPMDDDAVPYREALDRLAEIAPGRVFPAHGLVFDDGPAAIAQTAATFDAFAASVLRNVGRMAPSGPVGAPQILGSWMERNPAIREADRALPGVLLGGIHAHLLRLEHQGAVAQVEPHAFRPA